MDTTIFLAQLWGPAILAVGIGVFVSRKYYIKIYRDLEKETFAILVFGIMAAVGGVAHILAHNTWNSFTEGLISFLGWALLLKGIVFLVIPDLADRIGDHWVNRNLVSLAGIWRLSGLVRFLCVKRLNILSMWIIPQEKIMISSTMST